MSFSWSWITDNLATGGRINDPTDVGKLLVGGVTHVLNVREVDEDEKWLREAFTSRAGYPVGRFDYCFNPTADDGQHPKPVEWFKRSLDFALPVLAPAFASESKLYVHCAAGLNRGPSSAYTILRALGWSKLGARLLIYWKRPLTLGGLRYAHDGDLALAAMGYTT